MPYDVPGTVNYVFVLKSTRDLSGRQPNHMIVYLSCGIEAVTILYLDTV